MNSMTTEDFNVSTAMLEHDGGTKFYEMVVVEEQGGPAVLVKRWGTMAQRNGGGQTKVDVYANRTLAWNELVKTLREKERARGDKGQYVKVSTPPSFGLHRVAASVKRLTGAVLMESLKDHFASSDISQIIRPFNLDLSDLAPDVLNDIIEEFATPEEPVERGENWGSW